MTTPKIETQALVEKAYRAFFSPGKYTARPADQVILERGANSRIPLADGELAVTTWGEGPAVLLVHGWGGARAQMTGFVDPLLEAGYRVVAFDQPAHGESDGRMTNLLEIAPAMDLIAQQEGKFQAILAHSFGTLLTSYVLVQRDFPPPDRLVYFGAFNRLMDSLPRFQVLAGLPDAAIEALRLMIYDKIGQSVVEAIINEELAPQIAIPAIMFHDKQDHVTPIEDSRAIARGWEYAQLIETERLGHRGALQSPPIHTKVVKFLQNGKA